MSLFYLKSSIGLTSNNLVPEEHDTALVDFLYTSRYVAIFCDTDCTNQIDYDNSKFKKRVTTTLDRLAELNRDMNGNNKFLEIT